jgi:alpha-beta hydrolase superfamily lysophospholipase
MQYAFSPAAMPATAPTVVIFHGHQYSVRPTAFKDPRYNVIAPLDHFGPERCGSWWLGEAGEFFVVDMISSIVDQAYAETGSSELFTWGSSMGGYAALLYAMQLKACAAYAHIPQTLLIGSHYGAGGMGRYFAAALGPGPTPEPIYNDLCLMLERIVETGAALPLFFLSANRFDHPYYLEEQVLRFVTRLRENDANFALQIHPVHGHSFDLSLRATIEAMVETYRTVTKDAPAT